MANKLMRIIDINFDTELELKKKKIGECVVVPLCLIWIYIDWHNASKLSKNGLSLTESKHFHPLKICASVCLSNLTMPRAPAISKSCVRGLDCSVTTGIAAVVIIIAAE